VDIVRVGGVSGDVLDFLSEGLARELGAKVTSGRAAALPSDAYDPSRGQHASGAILAGLGGPERRRETIVLGVTSVDLFAPGLNFVFGEAQPAERKCVISVARLGLTPGGKPAAPGLLKERALKEAVHEIGHVLGLGHCGRRTCVMFFSNSILDTDRKGRGFCPACRRPEAGAQPPD
jgi:archaemetzincin